MNNDAFQYLIKSIFAAKESEILCGEFFDVLPQFVDLQLSGQDAAATFPDIGHHLHQCPECNEVYLALLQEASQPERDSGIT